MGTSLGGPTEASHLGAVRGAGEGDGITGTTLSDSENELRNLEEAVRHACNNQRTSPNSPGCSLEGSRRQSRPVRLSFRRPTEATPRLPSFHLTRSRRHNKFAQIDSLYCSDGRIGIVLYMPCHNRRNVRWSASEVKGIDDSETSAYQDSRIWKGARSTSDAQNTTAASTAVCPCD